MSNQIIICLSASQWEELEKHLRPDACPKRVGLPEFTLIQEDDCRPLLDEAQYEILIRIARTHCSDLVPLIEKQTGFLVFRHQFTAKDYLRRDMVAVFVSPERLLRCRI